MVSAEVTAEKGLKITTFSESAKGVERLWLKLREVLERSVGVIRRSLDGAAIGGVTTSAALGAYMTLSLLNGNPIEKEHVEIMYAVLGTGTLSGAWIGCFRRIPF